MLPEIILLFALTVGVIIGVPSYLYFRQKMLKRPEEKRIHSARRVLKLTLINFGLNFLAAGYFLVLFVLIFLRGDGISIFLPSLILYIIITWVTFYGNGIYLTSIVLEDFTLPQLRLIKEFSTQFIATHLFHGPISHILIYSGWILAFLSLSLLDIDLHLQLGQNFVLPLLIAGGVMGIFYALGMVYNGTSIYQFITGFASAVVIITFIFLKRVNLSTTPIATYFLGFIVVFDFCLFLYVCWLEILESRGKKVVWDTSGGPGVVDKKDNMIRRPFNL